MATQSTLVTNTPAVSGLDFQAELAKANIKIPSACASGPIVVSFREKNQCCLAAGSVRIVFLRAGYLFLPGSELEISEIS